RRGALLHGRPAILTGSRSERLKLGAVSALSLWVMQCKTPCPLWANSGHREGLVDHLIGALLGLYAKTPALRVFRVSGHTCQLIPTTIPKARAAEQKTVIMTSA